MSGYLTAFEISGSGMSVERLRLDVAATNLANAFAVRGAGGELYAPLRVVAQPAMAAASFGSVLDGDAEPTLAGVRAEILPVTGEARRVHQPGHPLADAQGFIEQPNVNPVVEMTEIMLAVRAYEANVKAVNAARAMAQRALQIGES